AHELVGPGVVKFEGRFTSAMEPNRQQLALPPPLGNHRFDFFVHRVDGSCMRLHPHANRDAVPVIGHASDWAPQAAPRASTPGNPMLVIRDKDVFRDFSVTDVVSAAEARAFLDTQRNAGTLHQDLTDASVFAWHRFLMGRPWGTGLLRRGVVRFELVDIPTSGVVFRVTLADDPEAPQIIRPSGQRMRLG
ncbi:MAG: hypothetical protein GY772_02495, partial [bacterium]|nr:hypothetical protein [bacterium]